ncbi:MAG TPA: GlsB/YeaQ/YmgE family stress response membrane protein [Candidatus Babeliales bacterium]|nr:GlsB/YeaQ/YmgE family stress response membrane protein [Candidatus Babeliales bacterium]
MVLNIIIWIIFGALAGWIASMIMHTNEEQGGFANIIVGIIGALIGGWIARSIFGIAVSSFSLGGLLVAIIGAVILLAILKAFGVFGGRGIGHRV